jgi:hypothetical protein
LRSDPKVLLYLNNIDEINPFAVLYPDLSSKAEINFQNSVSLETLDILFRDTLGNLFNFHNLPHSLSLEIEVRN